METNNKYYTPKIIEFYVGFEYQLKSTFHDGTVKSQEQFDDDINYPWNNTKVDSIQDLSYVQSSLHGRNAELNRCGTRVKYLDKEDIESFGFKPTKHNGVDCFEYDNQFRIFWFNKAYNPQVISIHKFIDDIPHEEQLYKGYILNKSEMKFILTRLGII